MALSIDPFTDPVPPPPEKPSQKEILEAVRDSVMLKTDRSKVARNHTSKPSFDEPAPSSRRTQSDESLPRPPRKPTKKAGGKHTDVIDKLDFTGIGAATLHHAGPFDACAPSRNVNKHKSPMAAWARDGEQEFSAPAPSVPNDSRISQRAQATMAAMAQMAPGFDAGPYPSGGFGDSPYPKMTGNELGNSDYGLAPPRKRHDALAEAWGIHEPEPFEDFMAGGGGGGGGDNSRPESIRSGIEGARRNGRGDHDDRSFSRRREPRTKLPPPAPIALPGQATYDDDSQDGHISNYVTSETDNAPKRSKSLLNRIKKMKANPNVPVSVPDDRDGSSPVAGEFGAQRKDDSSGSSSPKGDKEYFDRPASSPGVGAMPQSPGLGRKPSLMQKIRGAARGNKQQ